MTSFSQGSGFLYNNQGSIITNAHIVAGEVNVSINTIDHQEFEGKVIGYSNDTDVAIIYVHELEGRNPFPLELGNPDLIGKEVIAYGSPSGYDNIASKGLIVGEGNHLMIDNYIYEDLYEISSPISHGSSGGPLICEELGKIVAMNTAKRQNESDVGFSIPLYKVDALVQSWIKHPMNERTILQQYYNSQKDYIGSYLCDQIKPQ